MPKKRSALLCSEEVIGFCFWSEVYLHLRRRPWTNYLYKQLEMVEAVEMKQVALVSCSKSFSFGLDAEYYYFSPPKQILKMDGGPI